MPHPTRRISDILLLLLKGIAMGTANKVPGISGGVVAYVTGFYEEFLYSLRRLNLKSIRLLLTGQWRSFFTYVNGRFMSILLLGEAISYFTISKGFDVLLQNYPIWVWALFFGLILGSIYYICIDFPWRQRRYLVFIALGSAIGIGTSFLEPATQNDNLFFVFFCGIISVCGMTLPGLSGSFILILLGNYVLLLVDSINALFDSIVMSLQGDFSWWSNPIHMDKLTILLVFVLGSIAGLISLSHLLGYTIKNYKNQTNAIIIGFITGSLGVVWPWKKEIIELQQNTLTLSSQEVLTGYQRYLPELTTWHTFVALWIILLGFCCVYLVQKYESIKKINTPHA